MNRQFPNNRFRSGRKMFFLPLFILMILALGGLVHWLWNAILPEIANVKRIKYPQALGLLVLCRILFGNFGWKKNGQQGGFGARIKDRFKNMSEEEKQRFREEWRKRCKM